MQTKRGQGIRLKDLRLFGVGFRRPNSHLNLKAGKNREGVKRPNCNLDIKNEILLGTKFYFGNLTITPGYKVI